MKTEEKNMVSGRTYDAIDRAMQELVGVIPVLPPELSDRLDHLTDELDEIVGKIERDFYYDSP